MELKKTVKYVNSGLPKPVKILDRLFLYCSIYIRSHDLKFVLRSFILNAFGHRGWYMAHHEELKILPNKLL